MAGQGNVAPVIIKKVKKVSGGGHHGGAWKVAYADFVTAMMAFFLLMWLLNATTEQQRKGLADYFAPTIAISPVSGGGDGAFGGESVFSEIATPQVGTGATSANPTQEAQASGRNDREFDEETAELRQVEEMLVGKAGESDVHPEILKHIVTRVTDEGLVIELFDNEDATLFVEETTVPRNLLVQLAGMLVRVSALVDNKIAVEGHVHARPLVLNDNPVWTLSSDRAEAMRQLMTGSGLDYDRIVRVTGHADREIAVRNPMSPRNNRLEIILLRDNG
ncbi:flagellar motor protein MotB [Pseudooceanicola algae]|uniref:Motility protein B n=1 Tax=Pseudooceanicola algae TaxID=1537215 RepID=A0A418SB51_9RHOB|nr:flagellar motor protein MotB [Pseudooceanicola algae]QPM91351.1 Motility protein B [Pseudooceanicola algae]